jgi:hypothetical protein
MIIDADKLRPVGSQDRHGKYKAHYEPPVDFYAGTLLTDEL